MVRRLHLPTACAPIPDSHQEFGTRSAFVAPTAKIRSGPWRASPSLLHLWPQQQTPVRQPNRARCVFSVSYRLLLAGSYFLFVNCLLVATLANQRFPSVRISLTPAAADRQSPIPSQGLERSLPTADRRGPNARGGGWPPMLSRASEALRGSPESRSATIDLHPPELDSAVVVQGQSFPRTDREQPELVCVIAELAQQTWSQTPRVQIAHSQMWVSSNMFNCVTPPSHPGR